MAETSKKLKEKIGNREEGSAFTSAQQKGEKAEGERPSKKREGHGRVQPEKEASRSKKG